MKAAIFLSIATAVAAAAGDPFPRPLAATFVAGDPCATGPGAAKPPSCGAMEADLMRVAAIQLADFADGVNRTAEEEVTARTAKMVAYLAQAASLGVKIAAFPEMSTTFYARDVPVVILAEHFSRWDALLFTAMAWIFIPAHCFAHVHTAG